MLLPFTTPPARPLSTGLICVMLLIVSPVFGGNYAGSPTAFTSGHIELLTILGDSNSDLGNAKYAVQSFSKLTGGKVPNVTFYYKGRFSNGKIWGDNVYDAVDDLDVRSYAFGFGTACTANANPSLPKSFPASTQQQAEKYVADLKTKKLTAKRAVALWIGANDLANAFFIFPDGPSKPPLLLSNTEQVLKSVITCILDTASKLIAAGERRIIVWGIQPVQLSPFALEFIKPQPALGPVIANIVTTFNTQLQAQLAALQKASPKGVTLEYFDIYNPLLKALTGKVPGLGINDFSTPCLALTQNLLNQTITLSAPPCKTPDTVFFYDQVHMNRVVHKKVVAKTFVDFLKAKRYINKC